MQPTVLERHYEEKKATEFTASWPPLPPPPQGGGEVDMKKGGRGKLRRKKIKNEDEWAQIVI